MDFINSWKTKSKQWDKFALKLRLGKLTIIDIYADISRKQYGISLFNLGIKADKPSPQNRK